MIAKNIKNAVDIQNNGKRVLNVIKNGEVVYYYIPDSYVELEYGQITAPINIDLKNKSLIDYTISIIHDGEDVHLNNVFLKVNGNVRYLFSYGNYATSLSVNTVPYIAGELFSPSSEIVTIGVKATSSSMSLYRNSTFIRSVNYPANTLSANTSITLYNRYNDGKNEDAYKVLNFYIKESSTQQILNYFVFVRRLGDAICGMFDTINQKFYPSETQVQFKGGPIKTVKRELWLASNTESNNDITLNKYGSDRERGVKSFISNAINIAKRNTRTITYIKEDGTTGYKTEVTEPYIDSLGDFRVYPNRYEDVVYSQNINPNWNILKSLNVTANDFETNNQNLYFANKASIEVVPTGNKKGNASNISVAKDHINRIVHIPYLHFVGSESKYINIAPIDQTTETALEVSVNGLSTVYNSNNAVLGYWNGDTGYRYIIGYMTTGWSNSAYIGNGAESTRITYDEDASVIRLSHKELLVNGVRIVDNRFRGGEYTYDNFYLGNAYYYNNGDSRIGNPRNEINYVRFERKNSLYRHYLPALMILKDNNYYLGFYETVEQVFYSCDEKTLPAYKGDTLNSDWSNLIDINGKVIDFTKIKLNPTITVTGAQFLSDQSTGIADVGPYRTSGNYIHYKDTDNILDIERGIVGGYLMDNAGVFSPAPFSTPYYTTTITGLGDLTNDVQVYVRIRALTQYPEYDGVRIYNAKEKGEGRTYTKPKYHEEQVVHDSSYNSTLKGYINTITGTDNDGYILFKNDDSVAAYETTNDGMIIKHHVFTEAFLKRFANNTYDGINPFPYYMEHYFDFKLVHSSGVEYNETITMKYSSTSKSVRTRLLRWENVARVVYSDIPNPQEANPPVANNFLTLYPPVVPDSITTRTLLSLTKELYDDLYQGTQYGTSNGLNIKECLHNSIIRLVDVTISDDLTTTTYSNITVVHWKNECCTWNYGSLNGGAEMIISANDNTSTYKWDNSVSSDIITNNLLVYKNYDTGEFINEIQFTESGTTFTKLEDVCLHCTPEMFAALVEGQVSRENSTLNARLIRLKDIQDIILM